MAKEEKTDVVEIENGDQEQDTGSDQDGAKITGEDHAGEPAEREPVDLDERGELIQESKRYRERAQAAEHERDAAQALNSELRGVIVEMVLEREKTPVDLLKVIEGEPWVTEAGGVDVETLLSEIQGARKRLGLGAAARRPQPVGAIGRTPTTANTVNWGQVLKR